MRTILDAKNGRRGGARRARQPRRAVVAAIAILACGACCAGCGARSGEPRFDAVLIPMDRPAPEGATPAHVPVASHARPILFSVTIPAHMTGAGLETRILDQKGEIVWVGVGLRRAEGLATGQLLIPPGFLRPGDYRLAVGKAEPGVLRAEFPFRVD